jgi:transportin-1
MRNAYDTISTAAEQAPGLLSQPAHASLILPPLFSKLDTLQDGDRELLPLLECLTAVVARAGQAAEAHAAHAFFRCVGLAERAEQASKAGAAQGGFAERGGAGQQGCSGGCMACPPAARTRFRQQTAGPSGLSPCAASRQVQPTPPRIALQAAASGAYDPEEAAEFIVCALDFISGLAEGLGPSVESLVGRSPLRAMVVRACADPDADVRQSGFALVGDLAKACAPHIKPALVSAAGAGGGPMRGGCALGDAAARWALDRLQAPAACTVCCTTYNGKMATCGPHSWLSAPAERHPLPDRFVPHAHAPARRPTYLAPRCTTCSPK